MVLLQQMAGLSDNSLSTGQAMKLIASVSRSETASRAQAPLRSERLDQAILPKICDKALSSEWSQIQRESDPELRSQGLWNAATREELRGNLAFASEVYVWLSEHGNGAAREKARERLALLEGQGAFGQRAEHLLRGFARDASDPAMLLAMGIGGGVYKATKLATMSRLVGGSGYLGRGLGMKLAGGMAGYALEAPVFTAVGRWGRGEELLGPGIKEELLSSYLVLGAMKGVGGLSRELSRGWGHPRLERFAGDVGLYGGILLGHKLEAKTGLRPWQEGGQEWADGLAMFFQLKASGRLLNQLAGERYRGMERELEYRSERLAAWGDIQRAKAANDGAYQTPLPRIGRAADPSERAANDAKYEEPNSLAMPLASGAEPFHTIGDKSGFESELPSQGLGSEHAEPFKVYAADTKGSDPNLWQRVVQVVRGFSGSGQTLHYGTMSAMGEGRGVAEKAAPSGFQAEYSELEFMDVRLIADPGVFLLRDLEGSFWIGLGKAVGRGDISHWKETFPYFSKFQVLPSPKIVKQGQYATVSWFGELFSSEAIAAIRTLDLSEWDLESRWVQSIRKLAFTHPNMDFLEEVRIGGEVFRPSEAEKRLREKLLEFRHGDTEYNDFTDKDVHPFRRMQALREAEWDQTFTFGDFAYLDSVRQVLDVFLDPTVSKQAMADSVRPLRRPGGYPHALRLETARIFVDAVELSGSTELAEAGTKAFWKVLDDPRVVSEYGVPRQEKAAMEAQVRRDLFPMLLRLLPYLPTDSIEVTQGFLRLDRAKWLRSWDAISLENLQARRNIPEREDSAYRHDGPDRLAPLGGFVPAGLAYAYYLEAASPYQLELSLPVRKNAGHWFSGLLLAAENGHPEALRALTIWARHDPWAAQVIDSLPVEGGIRRALEAPWRETDRIAERRLHELTEKRKSELESTLVGLWVKAMFPEKLTRSAAASEEK